MASKTSKKAMNAAAKPGGRGKDSTGASLVISTGGGAFCYLQEAGSGRNLHVKVGSGAFVDAVRGHVAAGSSDRLIADLRRAGLDAAVDAIGEAGVLDSE